MSRPVVCLLLCLLLGACGQEAPANKPGVGTIEADGRWIVVNYWAIWCAPCREEIPEINEFAEKFEDTAAVYAVNFDNVRGDTLLQQAAELGIAFTLLEQDPAKQLGYARPTVLPTTIVINPQGELVARLLGTQTRDSLAAAMDD